MINAVLIPLTLSSENLPQQPLLQLNFCLNNVSQQLLSPFPLSLLLPSAGGCHPLVLNGPDPLTCLNCQIDATRLSGSKESLQLLLSFPEGPELPVTVSGYCSGAIPWGWGKPGRESQTSHLTQTP